MLRSPVLCRVLCCVLLLSCVYPRDQDGFLVASSLAVYRFHALTGVQARAFVCVVYSIWLVDLDTLFTMLRACGLQHVGCCAVPRRTTHTVCVVL